MSLIHRALDQPELPRGSQATGYNPLSRPPSTANRFWWWLTALAVVTSLAVLGLRWLEPRVPALPFGADTGPEPVARVAASAPPSAPTEGPGALPTPAAAGATPEPSQPETPVPANAPAEPEPVRQPQPVPANASTRPVEPAPSAAPKAATEHRSELTTTRETDQAAMPAPAPRKQEPEPGAPPPADPEPRAAEPESGSVRIARPEGQDRQEAVEMALDSDRVEQAEGLLRDWIRQSPDESLPRLWLAKIYLSNQRYAAADALLEGETDVEALGLRGLVLEKTARYDEAVRIFEHLTRREPDNPQWWLHWAINRENSGQPAQARDLYQTYVEQFSAYNTRLTAFARQRYQALEGN